MLNTRFATKLNLFVILFIGYISVVSSDADVFLVREPTFPIPEQSTENIIEDIPPIDSMWEDVVEAAFASPMEWIQLRQALDRVSMEDSRWHTHHPQLFHLSHPEIKFTYHKVYQVILGKTPSASNRIGTSAIAAMSVSSNDDGQTNLEEKTDFKKKKNPNLQQFFEPYKSSSSSSSSSMLEMERLSLPFTRTSLQEELIESLSKHKKVIKSKKDFHWRPWIQHLSMSRSGSDEVADDEEENNSRIIHSQQHQQHQPHISLNQLEFQHLPLLQKFRNSKEWHFHSLGKRKSSSSSRRRHRKISIPLS